MVYKILSIDGGGIRGIIPATILMEIEKRTGRSISSLFDLISGTSTGGILALGLSIPGEPAKPQFSAEDLKDFYFDRGAEIFYASVGYRLISAGGFFRVKYPIKGVSTALDEVLGNTRLKELLNDVLITSYDIRNRMAWFFRSARARVNPAYDFPLFTVARATSAAPSYFQPIQVEEDDDTKTYNLVDGGVYANNPAMCAYAEAVSQGIDPKDIVLVSIGTGTVSNDPSRGIQFKKSKNWGVIKWGIPLIKVVFHSLADTVEYQLRHLLPPDRYFRCQTILKTAAESLDDARHDNLYALSDDVVHYIRDNSAYIDSLCDRILE